MYSDDVTTPTQPPLDLSKGVPRSLLRLDCTLDVVFKYLFEDAELLMGFLNRVLHLQEGELITALQYLDRAGGPQRLGHRGVIFDLLVTDQAGVTYEVELQRLDQGAQLSRVFYYGARLLSAQLSEGDDFSQLKPVRVVLLTRFELFPDPHPARTFYPTPYLISAATQGLNLEGRAPLNVGFDLSNLTHYHQKKAFERRARELSEMRQLLNVTVVEFTKDLSALTSPAQRCLTPLSPTAKEERLMNSSNPTHPIEPAELSAEEELVELPEGYPDDPWVRSYYARLQRFAGDPSKVAEYERADRDLKNHLTYVRFAERTGREEGFEAGHAVGHAEARAQLLRVTIPSLLSVGKSPEEICALLQLTDAERAAHLPRS